MDKSATTSNKSRTYLINGDYIKFHTVFKDGMEIVEELGLFSEEYVSRKVKTIGMTGKAEWVTEIGDEPVIKKGEDFLFRENDKNPILIRKDTATEFQWRVRNLQWPKDNYIVECDKEKQQIVIKTVNKKYYKRISIPDLARLKLYLEPPCLKVNYMNNTLVITYTKPKGVIDLENELLTETRRIRAEIKSNPEAKYDPGCKNQ